MSGGKILAIIAFSTESNPLKKRCYVNGAGKAQAGSGKWARKIAG
jgi:hypothetical protein